MLRGLKHAMRCTKCDEVKFCEPNEIESLENKPSECCGAPYEYIGAQPFFENIIRGPESVLPKVEIVSPPVMPIVEEIIKREIIEESVAVVQNVQSTLNINDIIPAGIKVTNLQMIPAIKNALDEDSKEKLSLLKSCFPIVFEGSVRYLSKKYQDKLLHLI